MTRDFLITGREVDDLTPLEEQIRDVCRGIYDPEIPIPIWDMGLIYGWTITEVDSPEGEDGVRVEVKMTLTAPNCPAAESLPAEVEVGINALDGVAQVAVEIVFVPSYSMEMLGDEARLTLGLM